MSSPDVGNSQDANVNRLAQSQDSLSSSSSSNEEGNLSGRKVIIPSVKDLKELCKLTLFEKATKFLIKGGNRQVPTNSKDSETLFKLKFNAFLKKPQGQDDLEEIAILNSSLVDLEEKLDNEEKKSPLAEAARAFLREKEKDLVKSELVLRPTVVQLKAIKSISELMYETKFNKNQRDLIHEHFSIIMNSKPLALNDSNVEILQIASLLGHFRNVLNKSLYAEYKLALPENARQYLNIIMEEDSWINFEESFQDRFNNIMNLFPENAVARHAAIANFVNVKEISLKTLLNYGLDKSVLLEMAPYLRFMDLRGICEEGDPTFEIKLLEKCPNLNVLHIKNPYIQELPPLPNCQSFHCEEMTLLTTLPELRMCRSIVLTDCPAVHTLPTLHMCRSIELYGCLALRALPELQRCLMVTLRDCPALQTLPELQSCLRLYCSLCPSLQIFSALVSCRNLSFVNCNALQTLPPLPCCIELRIEGCPALQGMPEVPINAAVYIQNDINSLNNISFTQFKVDVKKLADNPKKFLLQLGREYLLRNKPFPNVYYVNEEGEKSPAVDVGGVRRDFITRLFESLFMEREDGPKPLPVIQDDKGVWPLAKANDAELQICYQTIGRLFALCCSETSDFKIGNIFYPALFEVLKSQKSDSEEVLIRNLLLSKKLPETILQLASEQLPDLEAFNEETLGNAAVLVDEEAQANNPADFSQQEVRAKLRAILLEEARTDKYGRLRAVSCIASEMEKAMGEQAWTSLCQKEASAIQNKIQGELSRDLLKEKLTWPVHGGIHEGVYKGVTQAQTDRIKGFLESWIDQANPDQLRKFVRAVTSNNTLGPHKIIVDVYNRAEKLIPISHTCFFTLELTANCPDKDIFNNMLKIFLEYGLAGDGFQAA